MQEIQEVTEAETAALAIKAEILKVKNKVQALANEITAEAAIINKKMAVIGPLQALQAADQHIVKNAGKSLSKREFCKNAYKLS